MKILKLTMLAFGFLLLNASSCCKDENEETLPPETQTGANTFGCLVNGAVWRNEGLAPFPGSNLNVSVSRSQFVIGASKITNNIDQILFIKIYSPISVGKYDLNNASAGFNDVGDNCYYQTDSMSSMGTLEITKFDTVNYIVSGIFNFKAIKLTASTGNCDSTINVTEGRFDIKYAN